MLSPVTSPALTDLPGIRHAYFTRTGGASTGLYASLNGGLGSSDRRELVLENRARMASHMGVTQEHFLNVWQVHSADVVAVDAPWQTDERPKADAMVTATEGLSICVATADCGPVLFADARHRVVGAAHAGWQGAFNGVLEETISAMEKLGAVRHNIIASIGPMLSQRNYEVGPEFVARFLGQDDKNQQFFVPSTRAHHALFDLPAYNRARLERAGVAVHDVALCTYADEERFFSYRRATHRAEIDYGRLISAIALTAQ